MGAQTFIHTTAGKDMAKAFKTAVYEAEVEYGSGPYSGSIAGKYSVCRHGTGTLRSLKKAYAVAQKACDDERYQDKWNSPAGAIRVVDRERQFDGWVFFGWAAS